MPMPKRYHYRRLTIHRVLEKYQLLRKPMIGHSVQPGFKKESKNIITEQIREVAAYNVGDPGQKLILTPTAAVTILIFRL